MDESSDGGARRGGTTAAPGTALAILQEQHGEIRNLLNQVADGTGVHRQNAFDALRELLAAHEAAEELVLRPAARRITSRAVASARGGEERQIAGMLAELERLDVDSRAFDEVFGKLAEAVVMHTWLEEAEEFPALESRWSEEQHERLGAWIRRAVALAPTHPHPLVTGSSVAQWTVGPFAALLDRARDRIAESGDEPLLARENREGAW
ncbi:MAG TPA: hemerythrin domain-containing protein [Actinospica sp.]|jgi:hypothetical protein|nr:hemerythrin domain-containing protein [Actinospica sp.]